VLFHTRVYIHAGQAQDSIVSGVLGEGGRKAPSPPARGSGGAL